MKTFNCTTAFKMSIAVLLVCISIAFDVSLSSATTAEELSKQIVFLRYKFQAYTTIDDKQVEVWYKSDPKVEEYKPLMNEKSGTGFLINYNQHSYLVTAKHVAEFLGDDAEIVINTTYNKTESLTFKDLRDCKDMKNVKIIPGAKWFVVKNADIAIHPFCNWHASILNQTAVPEDRILKGEQAIPLLSTVYVLGFPLRLGVNDILTPIAKEVKTASVILNPNHDIKYKYMLLDQALAQGYSGSPVFLIEDVMSENMTIGNKPVLKVGEKVSVIGLQSSEMSDEAGGKISVVVPSSYIWDIFQSPDFISYEKNLEKN